MKNLQVNIDILKHIKRYCDEVQTFIERFGNDINIFKNDTAFRAAVSMNVLQIGELSNHLTEDFRDNTKNEIPWKEVKAMRNLFAHRYGKMNMDTIWATATEDIPLLQEFCERQIKMSELYNQEALEPEYEDEFDEEI